MLEVLGMPSVCSSVRSIEVVPKKSAVNSNCYLHFSSNYLRCQNAYIANDSNEDLVLPNQAVHTNLVEITNRVLNDQNKLEEQNLVRTDTNYIEHSLNNSLNEDLEFVDYSDIQNNISDESTEEQDVELFDHSNYSDSQSNTSDRSDRQSDLSDITNIDINEYAKYDNLYAGKPRDLEDINQEFPLKEYAEFMHIVMRFCVQNPLANAFIRFFNKYSNFDDHLLPSTSQDGRAFIEDLNLPYFVSGQQQYSDMYNSDWCQNIEQNIPIGAYVMPIILYSDATLCDHLGKTSRHPAFMMLGNIPLARHNKSQIVFSIFGAYNLRLARKLNQKFFAPGHWYFNVYTMCIPDCMYHTDLGLFQYQLRFTIELLKLKYSSSAIKILEKCLTKIPRYSKLKVFKNGIEGFNRLTAAKYRELMKIMLFILNELIIDKKLNKHLCDLYYFWIDMYILSHQPKFTKFDLDNFENPFKKAIKQMTQHTIDQVINQLQNADNSWINGFKQLKHCIYYYFLSIENWTSYDIKHENILIEVFDFAYFDNDNRVNIRAVSNYYNQAAFSDVCIEMDELEQNDYLTDNGMCYAKVLEKKVIFENG
ncbi:hypothetical protein C2G38_2029966 [Gigaspora rosea]|uniref:Uncharacterized protein n=1 Tax=Gigaspora rosea TaxID=44941 RepID=A0A397VZH1_9GLOM|nr:hypothetical protein C2G38_2029966 [Gigaspora rosea]